MPVPVTENSIIAVSLDGRHDGQQVLLTLNYKLEFVTPSAPDPDMVALFDALHGELDALGGLNGDYLNVLTEDMTVPVEWIQQIYPIRRVRRPYSPGDGEGHVAEPGLPPSDAHVITLQGTGTTRHDKGNKHIGGVPLTFSENGEVTAAGLTAYNTLVLSLIDPIDVTIVADDYRFNPIILNRDTPAGSAPVSFGYVQQTTRIMRRRTVGLGS